MKALCISISFLVIILLLPHNTMAAKYSHNSLTTYEGPKTCATCHPKVSKEVAMSLHYQHAAEPKFVEGWGKGVLAGMMVNF
jgi:hypothetical protein